MTGEPLIWALVDDRAGNVAQTLGVAEALGRPFVEKRLSYTPLAKLHHRLQGASLLGLTAGARALLAPPWPDLVIAAGRRTSPAARWIKRQSGARLVQLMYPGGAGLGEFDLVVVPRHDGDPTGTDQANVIRITGAPHRMRSERLAAARAAWSDRLGHLPRPYIALVTGGATHSRPFPEHLAQALGRTAHRISAQARGSILLATSRRTGVAAEQALVSVIPEPRRAFLWSQGGDNPYAGFLALADATIVTGDSVSMCSEACATDRPVYIFAPEGMATAKHMRLHRELTERGLARPLPENFTDGLLDWRHPPLNAADDVRAAVERLLQSSSARG